MSLSHLGLSKQQGFSGNQSPWESSSFCLSCLGYLRIKIQSLFGVLWSANCRNTQTTWKCGKERSKRIWKIFGICRLEIIKRNLGPEDSDQCSMWSGQVSDTADSQAWGTAGVTVPLARWHQPLWDQPLLDFLLEFSRLLTREVCCIQVMSLAGPDELVSVSVH